MNDSQNQSQSTSWLFFVKASFVISIAAMAAGIAFMPGDLMEKGYFTMGSLFLISASFTLSKTIRDQHESQRMINKINEAKTNKILNEFSE